MDSSPGVEHEFFVQWHLTERCNLRCRHCYQGAAPGREMDLDEVREVAAEVGEMVAAWEDAHGLAFAKSYSITGGEPLLRKDLFEVLDAVGRGGFAVHLLSNGTLVGPDEARRLAGLGVAGVQVSLEGPERVHDRIRGAGSFAAAVRGASALVGAGVAVSLNVTLSGLNALYVEELVRLAQGLGARRIGFARLVPCGRGAELSSHVLTAREMEEVYRHLLELDAPGLEVASGDPLASQLRAGPPGAAGAVAVGGCAAGVSGLTILADGTVSPCRRMDLALGNVRTDSLRELWAGSPVLEALRDKARYGPRCRACDRWAACRGCRAVAYAHARASGRDDFLADDPQCFFPPTPRPAAG